MSELKPLTPKTADAVWIVTAILHKENENRDAFKIKEITDKVKELFNLQVNDATISIHVSSHCVANTYASPDKNRILYKVDRALYRLYRPGDTYDRSRADGKTKPHSEAIPKEFQFLLEWYSKEYCNRKASKFLEASRRDVEPSVVRITNNKIELLSKVLNYLDLREGDHILIAENTKDTMILRKARMAYLPI